MPTVPLPLGEAVELQHDDGLVRHHQRLDPPPQAAQTQCDHRLAQLKRGGDVVGFGGWGYYDSCIVWTGYNWVNVCY